MKLQTKAFTLVEIIIAIVVFLIGVAGVYAIMQSTMNINSYNRDYIIATNLAREQIELVRNIRDTNISKIQAYNILEPNSQRFDQRFESGKTYRISNDFSGGTELVNIKLMTNSFDESKLKDMGDYRVCRFTKRTGAQKYEQAYDYCENKTSYSSYSIAETPFYKYIEVSQIEDKNGTSISLNKGFKVISKVVWKGRKVNSFEVQAIFTDYKIF